MQTILEKIIEQKHHEVALLKSHYPLSTLKDLCQDAADTRGFFHALVTKNAQECNAIIAEVKKASPSKGLLCQDYQPQVIAKAYEQAGASCVSVLTDERFFLGSLSDLELVRQTITLPLLRKDFIVDASQVYQSRVAGADCILLIAAALNSQQLAELSALADELSMDVLFEIHNDQELNKILPLQPKLIGINNRNLHDFSVDLETTIKLSKSIDDAIIIAESGIQNVNDIQHFNQNGIFSFLIGETLMCSDNIHETLTSLIRG